MANSAQALAWSGLFVLSGCPAQSELFATERELPTLALGSTSPADGLGLSAISCQEIDFEVCGESIKQCFMQEYAGTMEVLDCHVGRLRSTTHTLPLQRYTDNGATCTSSKPRTCCLHAWPCWTGIAGEVDPTTFCPVTCQPNREPGKRLQGCPFEQSSVIWNPVLESPCEGDFVCDQNGVSLAGRDLASAEYFYWCSLGGLQRGTLGVLNL